MSVTRTDVIDVVGRIDDEKIAAIIATGASVEELVEAYEWAADEADDLAEAGRSLSGTVAVVYDILVAGEQEADER
jgi:hypothetical protein